MSLIRCLLAIVALAGAYAHATFAQNYPSRPIRLIVPFPAGGTADVVARILAQPVGQALGQSIVVDNRAGADGALAAALVMNSAPDGHTLFLASNSPMSAVPTMRRKPPYDPRTDFTAISLVGKFTFFMFMNPAVPAKTLTEFIDYARANPGKLNYASGNTTGIVTMAQLALLAKLDMTHVPYKGDAPTTADLIAGRVQSAFMALVPAFALAKEGKLRVLATLLTKRSALAPEVPTMAEAGMPGVSVASWLGLFAPAKLPEEITARLAREFNAALRRPEIIELLAKQGFEAQGSTPAELAAHVREQIDVWTRVVRDAKIPVE
jgi:tripartite-type tricarboxylate transporter receptor subunit TctC